VENRKGVRAAPGTTAAIDALEIVRQAPLQIVIMLTGRWRHIPRFSRRIEINPRGFHPRLEADSVCSALRAASAGRRIQSFWRLISVTSWPRRG
jgi:hypothetical protein